jgi:hypothetical protein
MSQSKPKRIVGIYDPEKRVLNRTKLAIEHAIKRISEVEFISLPSLKPEDISSCDVSIICGPNDTALTRPWLEKLVQQFSQPQLIRQPVVILSSWNLEQLSEILNFTIQQNWYFDIINPDHIASLPIRLANLIRLHDHLKELANYDRIVRELSDKVQELEANLRSQK